MDDFKDTPDFRLQRAASAGDDAGIAAALAEGALVDARSGDRGLTASMMAAYYGNEKSLRRLVEAGADIHLLDSDGRHACFYSISGGEPDCLRLLIASGANVETRDADGCTPAMAAAEYGCLVCIGILMRADADFDARDSSGRPPLLFARNGQRTEAIAMIRAHLEAQALSLSSAPPSMRSCAPRI